MDKPTPKPRYRVIAHISIQSFQEEVNEMLNAGYELYGDMIAKNIGNYLYFQAFVLKPTKKKRTRSPRIHFLSW